MQTEYRVKFHKLYCVISCYKVTLSIVFICVAKISYGHCTHIIRDNVKCLQSDEIFINDCICIILAGIPITEDRIFIKSGAHSE